ncbi:MAG: CHAT domain-containing protein [Acidobacteria bacterium]|nr:CHAT domain-containing protein [Acidobacteriota bacterium]
MLFRIDVQMIKDGWQVRVLDPKTKETLRDSQTGEPLLESPRLLRSPWGDPRHPHSFPLPPLNETEELANDKELASLINSDNSAPLEALMGKIAGRQIGDDETIMKSFGRYLFTTLIGTALWDKIKRAAGTQRIELGLCWPATDRAMNRLPWEMMYGPRSFLAAEPLVSLTRVVADTGFTVAAIESPPRVLFVIGSNLEDQEIRPGAEYLALLQSLRMKQGVSLKHHLLLDATEETLAAAVKEFRPTVVHFICHGGINSEGRGYLNLINSKKNSNERYLPIYAASLYQLLIYTCDPASSEDPAGEGTAAAVTPQVCTPQVIVLNACYTANAEDLTLREVGQVGIPFAVELVSAGIPIVVGMGGEVADQACRLFSRRFYESLLKDGDLAFATSVGRRIGIMPGSGTDPRNSLDWTLPTLFMSDGIIEPVIPINPQPLEQSWHEIANGYATPGFPPFCGRLDVFQKYDCLMADAETQHVLLQQEVGYQVLTVAVKEMDSKKVGDPKFGRTWLLKELAVKAARDGHVPCLVNQETMTGPQINWPPKSVEEIILAIKRAANRVSKYLQLEYTQWHHLNSLSNLAPGQPAPDDLHPEIKADYNKDPNDPLMLAVALRLDLLSFLKEIKSKLPGAARRRSKLLLLIDDTHRMQGATNFIYKALLTTYGLLSPDAAEHVRVIFSHSKVAAVNQEAAVDAIAEWQGSNRYLEASIDKFKPLLAARLAYEHFLFYWRNAEGNRISLVPVRDNKEVVASFFVGLRAIIGEVPSNFMNSQVSNLINMYLDPAEFPKPVLREAKDDEMLEMVKF